MKGNLSLIKNMYGVYLAKVGGTRKDVRITLHKNC